MPTIDKPTRVYNNSATLIDNIFINKFDDFLVSGNIVTDLTDHFSQFCILKSTLVKVEPEKIITRDYSQFSEQRFLEDLSMINWDVILRGDDIDKIFSTFYNKVNKITNKHAPFRTLSKRKSKQLSKPWITKGLKKSIKIKNELFYSGNRERYKLYRNKIMLLSRTSKKKYYHNFFELNITNMKKTWEGINLLINRKKKSDKPISSIRRPDNSGPTSNQSVISDTLNEHFASVGHRLASKIPQSHVRFSQYLPKRTYSDSLMFGTVLSEEIQEVINSIPLNKALGLYSCPTKILKSASHLLSKPLAAIINKSVEIGKYPSKLKHAKVIPVFKSGDELDPNNYRPISLLSSFNRIFEKLMYSRLKFFLDKHDVLYHSQYGFRERCSTEHALIDIVDRIRLNIDRRLYSCGIFIDLKKAFDTVDHSILLEKLEHYGIRGVVNNWFSSYLTDRYQSTQIGSCISKKTKTLCGVPQGSVLGPLLFLLYINDIYNSSEKFSFYLFADDTNLLYADKSLRSLENTVNAELSNVSKWLMANKLSLNVSKSNFVIFRPSQKKIDYNVDLKIYDFSLNLYVSLEHRDHVKYLGVLLDSNLSWKYHIAYVATKISKSLGILARLRHFVPSSTLLNIYKSLIQPYINYGLAVWGQAAQSNLNTILILQKRALRLINFAPFRSHAVPLFDLYNVLPLNFLYIKSICTIMHDVYNNKAPRNISSLFTLASDAHHYKTRFSQASTFAIQNSRTKQRIRSFSCSGAKAWNCIPLNIRSLPKHKFKAAIHRQLLNILLSEDDYVDTLTITSRFKQL